MEQVDYELASIVNTKTVPDETEMLRAETDFNFNFDATSFPPKSILVIQDQVLAWKVINYLAVQNKLKNATSARMVWKKKYRPESIKNVKKYEHTVNKTKEAASQALPDDDDDDEIDVFNYDLIEERQNREIEKMRKRESELTQQLLTIRAELSALQIRLNHCEAVRNGSYIPPMEHTAGGGVDQGEREEDEKYDEL